MTRVLRVGGRILLTDYEPGPARPARGWVTRAVIAVSELAADRSHRRNYRDFMAHGGLPPLLAAQRLSVDQRRVVAGGAIGLYLAGSQGPAGTTPGPRHRMCHEHEPASARPIACPRRSSKNISRIYKGWELEFTIPSKAHNDLDRT